jgi:hypothetical protein
MVKQVKISYGLHENINYKCVSCANSGVMMATADVPQSIYLIINRLDDKGNKITQEPYCLYCGREAIRRIELEMAFPSMDENERRRYKELSDWYHNLANYKKK